MPSQTHVMPELPEVETTRRGLAPHLLGRRIADVVLRRPDLRWPIPPEVAARLPGQDIAGIRRRAKYLLLDTAASSALLHLGMSGSLRVLPPATPVGAHDHVDLVLAARPGQPARVLRFNIFRCSRNRSMSATSAGVLLSWISPSGLERPAPR